MVYFVWFDNHIHLQLQTPESQICDRSVLSNWEFFHQNESCLLALSPSFITQGRMGARKAALILMKKSHFDGTLRYTFLICNAIRETEYIKGRNIFSYLTLSRMLPCVFGGSWRQFVDLCFFLPLILLPPSDITKRGKPNHLDPHTSAIGKLNRHKKIEVRR